MPSGIARAGRAGGRLMGVRVLHGDCRAVLPTLPAESVQMICTSPPYWGLRDYQHQDQLGAERTAEAYIATLTGVFAAAKRVLRSDGVMFLNLGDSFDGKNLAGIPWRVAESLKADGWVLRQEITWAKRAPMPESVTNRPTSSTEKVFLFAKSAKTTFWTHRDRPGVRTRPEPDYRWRHKETGEERETDPGDRENWTRFNLWRGHDYFYDAEAVREPNSPTSIAWGEARKRVSGNGETAQGHTGFYRVGSVLNGRNQRNFWLLGPEPFRSGGHFAVFPTEIPRRAILAGTSERGCCPDCGAPWQRVVERQADNRVPYRTCGTGPKAVSIRNDGSRNVNKVLREDGRGGDLATYRVITTGWRPTCSCPGDKPPVPCTVLDPFAGAGTTGLAAERLGRSAALIELNGAYCDMIAARLARARASMPLFDDPEAA